MPVLATRCHHAFRYLFEIYVLKVEKTAITGTHLQDEAEVRGGLVFALEVFAVVNVQVVQLDEADEVTGRLEGHEKSRWS